MNNVLIAIEDLKKGKMIVVTDHHTRENEGDLVLAAEFANSKNINFMASLGKGLICAPLTQKVAEKLNLPLMITENECTHKTAFTVSVDAKHNVSTGISAFDRAYTLKLLSSTEARAEDFSRPGHVFPLIAKDGGVLERPGHTEATVDLLKASNLKEVGVICEIMNDHGEMMRGNELSKFAEKYELTQVSIEEIIDFVKNQPNLHILEGINEARSRLN